MEKDIEFTEKLLNLINVEEKKTSETIDPLNKELNGNPKKFKNMKVCENISLKHD